MNQPLHAPLPRARAHGLATVEFAMVASVFFLLLFSIVELARVMYLFNTVQEVTRRAGREAAVRWTSSADQATAKTLALFGGSSLPAGAEITSSSITIEYLDVSGSVIASGSMPTDAADNIAACADSLRTANCIYSVRASISNVSYSPMISLFSFLNINLPSSAVTLHAESMGYGS
ncbi:MAG: TadE/TadG family type IV pilus assembly protein [Pseudomonadota bacterium]